MDPDIEETRYLVNYITYSLRYAGILVLLSLIANFSLRKYKEIKKKIQLIDRIPGPASFNPILGNIPFEVCKYIGSDFDESKDLYYTLLQGVRGYTEVYRKERIFRLWVGWEPVIVLWKPESADIILSHNFLLEKSSQYDFLHPWLGTGLLTSSGSKWRTRRKLLVPAFHFKILHDFVPVFNEQASVMVQKLKKLAKIGKPVDIVPLVTACTLDIICETVMGVSIKAQQNSNNPYCKAVTEVGECFLERIMQPSQWIDSIYYHSSRGKEFLSNLNLLHEFTRKVIKDRKNEILGITEESSYNKPKPRKNASSGDEETKRSKAFMDLLLDHHLNGGDITEEDIREEVDTFMFEGHDTTAMALSWIIFLLGHYPEIQERASNEVDALFEDLKNDFDNMDEDRVNLTLDKMKNLKYLECIIKEGLRLSPSVPFIGRRLHEDLDVKGYTVPAGTTVYVFIYMLHRDPEIFPNPELFNPDRFLPKEASGRHPFAFVPFSAGPRNCIGQRFAMSELKITLAWLLRYFRFESLDARDKILFNMEMVLRPKTPLQVNIIEREINKTPFSSLAYIDNSKIDGIPGETNV